MDLVSTKGSRPISTLKGTLIGVILLITLLDSYLLSPPTPQVGFRDQIGLRSQRRCEGSNPKGFGFRV